MPCLPDDERDSKQVDLKYFYDFIVLTLTQAAVCLRRLRNPDATKVGLKSFIITNILMQQSCFIFFFSE